MEKSGNQKNAQDTNGRKYRAHKLNMTETKAELSGHAQSCRFLASSVQLQAEMKNLIDIYET